MTRVDQPLTIRSGTRIGLLSTVDSPFLVRTIQALLQDDIAVDSVFLDSQLQTSRDLAIHHERTGGRFPARPLDECEEEGIPFYFVRNHSSEMTAALVRKRQIDLLVNAGTPRILGPDILAAPRRGILNCHPGLLPEFRGCSCVEWAIYLDQQVGNTVHFMNEGIDEGPIVLREGLTFGKRETYVDVRVKVHEHGLDLLARAVKRLIETQLSPSSFGPQGEGRYFRAMQPALLEDVKWKLERGEYVYQR